MGFFIEKLVCKYIESRKMIIIYDFNLKKNVFCMFFKIRYKWYIVGVVVVDVYSYEVVIIIEFY